MHRPRLFDSFFLGGFECSSHRRHDGRRLDLLASTRHDRHALADYRRLASHGLRSVRDGLRWHLIEAVPGRYDFSSFLPMLESSERTGTQVIWDLCHYGIPDDIDIWCPSFVDRFARYAAAVSRLLRDRGGRVPFYCVVNEMSFWAWAGGDHALMNPGTRGRGLELKHQLVRAGIAATLAIREVDPSARFVHVDPIIHVVSGAAETDAEAIGYRRAQYDSWLLMTGELWPSLGGHPSLLDIVGVNYYPKNQWIVGGEAHGRVLEPGEPGHRPLHRLLIDAAARLKRPLLIAETGAEGAERAPWLRQVVEEGILALAAGVPLEGICLYPVLDYPGWANERHCETGLYGPADAEGRRALHGGLAEALRSATRRLQEQLGESTETPTTLAAGRSPVAEGQAVLTW